MIFFKIIKQNLSDSHSHVKMNHIHTFIIEGRQGMTYICENKSLFKNKYVTRRGGSALAPLRNPEPSTESTVLFNAICEFLCVMC